MDNFVGPRWNPWATKAEASNAWQNVVGNLRPGLQQPLVKLVAPWITGAATTWNPWGTKAKAKSACQHMIGNLRLGLQQPLVKLVAPWITLWALYGAHGAPKHKPSVLARM